jgi:RimJ/RimL family protein N-acetyltransferase
MVLDHVFTSLPHEVDAVTASIFPDNVASEKLLKKLWFLYDHSLENGMQVSLVVFPDISGLTELNHFLGKVYRLGKDRWFKRKAGKEAPSKKDVKEEEASEADVEDA